MDDYGDADLAARHEITRKYRRSQREQLAADAAGLHQLAEALETGEHGAGDSTADPEEGQR